MCSVVPRSAADQCAICLPTVVHDGWVTDSMVTADLWRMGVLEAGIDSYLLQVSNPAAGNRQGHREDTLKGKHNYSCSTLVGCHTLTSTNVVCNTLCLQDPTSEWLSIHPVLRQTAARVGAVMQAAAWEC